MSDDPGLQLTPVSVHVLRHRLVKQMTEENFEQFAFQWLCERTNRRAELQPRIGRVEHDACSRIISLTS